MQRPATLRLLLFAVMTVLGGLFFVFDLGQYLTLDFIKTQQGTLTGLYDRHPVPMLLGYFAMYVAVTALSLPGAVVMTLAGGAVFGFWPTLLTVSFASTIGASLAFLAARFMLRDWVQARFGPRLQRINDGIAREGYFYLFTLRLVPAVPFFLINLGMGLTSLRVGTFYWVSQVGMLPGTAVFVNAGKELGKIESLSGILSPSLLVSFALLGIFPLATRKAVQWIRSSKTAERAR